MALFGEDGPRRDGNAGWTPGVLRARSEAGEDASNTAEGGAGEKGPVCLFSRS